MDAWVLPFQIFRSFELVKTQMALMHWDYIDRLGKSNSIRTAIQENIYDDNIHFIVKQRNASLKCAIPDYSYWLKHFWQGIAFGSVLYNQYVYIIHFFGVLGKDTIILSLSQFALNPEFPPFFLIIDLHNCNLIRPYNIFVFFFESNCFFQKFLTCGFIHSQSAIFNNKITKSGSTFWNIILWRRLGWKT
jgi:hypothetical protein